jgi:hypothetical protein
LDEGRGRDIVIASGIGLETLIARSEATKQSILPFARRDGLLRFARNDGKCKYDFARTDKCKYDCAISRRDFARVVQVPLPL